MAEHAILVDNDQEVQALFGKHDHHLRRIEQALGVAVVSRGSELKISGSDEAVPKAAKLFEDLLVLIRAGSPLHRDDVEYALRAMQDTRLGPLRQVYQERIEVPTKRRFILPRTAGQRAYVEAMRKHDIVFGIGPAGTGKCVAGSTLVLTDRGLMPIQALGLGTAVDSYTPITCQIAGLHGPEAASHVYNGGRSVTCKIRTRLGFRIETTPEHPLLRLGGEGETAWTPAIQLRVGDYVAIQRGQEMFGNATAVDFTYQPNGRWDHSKAVHLGHLDESFAYFLGLMTGDGCLTSKNRVILSSADQEILAAFEATAKRWALRVFPNGGSRPYDRIIASSQLYQLLLHVGFSGGPAVTKCVPKAILGAPRALVVAFLQGLFDTDGTVNRRDGQPQLCSISERLIEEVQLLLLNLGILANRRRKLVKHQGRRRLSFLLEMTGTDADRFFECVGFRLARKQALRRKRPRNTNVDLLPHVPRVMHAALAATGPFPRHVHKAFDDYKRGRRQPSYAALDNFLSVLGDGAFQSPAGTLLAELQELHFFWARIEEIGQGEAAVYDLTVPGSHAFCANGFVNHNTYLAMAMAVESLTKGEVSRIILTRPAVEAGERLGYLPGDLAEKINPYLRPLYDALYEMLEMDMVQRYMDRGLIEVAPLAYMRGRTLNDSFIILDEAQNTTSEQMKMFLTRLGFDSKAVITGDVTQIDLPADKPSGLIEAQRLLDHIPGIKIATFGGQDVVRHELVQAIIEAYDRHRTNGAGKA